jgi:hypothetical protein
VILAVFITTLVLLGAITVLQRWNSHQPETGRREPLPSLSYCSSNQLRPCVLSFSLDTHENLVINILTDRQATNVYLKVRQGQNENVYKCQSVEGFSSNLACSGKKLPPGEAFSFLVVSVKDDIPFAEGTFPIIGLAIATPNIFVTPTFIPAFDRPPK